MKLLWRITYLNLIFPSMSETLITSALIILANFDYLKYMYTYMYCHMNRYREQNFLHCILIQLNGQVPV